MSTNIVQYYLPVICAVTANTFYHICAKQIPSAINPMAMLVVTYLIAAAVSFIAFALTSHGVDLIGEIKLINWAPAALGFCVVSMEISYIMIYRAGWDISLASLVNNIAMATVLLIVGIALYKEHINSNQAIGIFLCVAGLIFVAKK